MAGGFRAALGLACLALAALALCRLASVALPAPQGGTLTLKRRTPHVDTRAAAQDRTALVIGPGAPTELLTRSSGPVPLSSGASLSPVNHASVSQTPPPSRVTVSSPSDQRRAARKQRFNDGGVLSSIAQPPVQDLNSSGARPSNSIVADAAVDAEHVRPALDAAALDAQPTPPSSHHRSAVRVDLAIARYNEPLDWLANVLRDLRHSGMEPVTFVYEKFTEAQGAPAPYPGATTVRLPNVGRESYAYLHHMASALSRPGVGNVTVFLQAAPHKTPGLTYSQLVQALILQAMMHGVSTNVRNTDRRWRPHGRWDARAGFFVSGPRSSLKLGAWWDDRMAAHFQVKYPNESVAVSFFVGANFAVHRLVRLPESFLLGTGWRDELGASNDPAEGHFYERSWFFMFYLAREALPPGVAPLRWRTDSLDPYTLERRHYLPPGPPRTRVLVWDWEGCSSDWEQAARVRQPPVIQCTPLARNEQRWAWEGDS